MTANARPSAPSVGRFTTAILFLVALICVAMIGGTAYLKFQMDRAETLLAAPDAAVGSDQDLFDRLRRTLGYGGFLGLAQNYIMRHDASGFSQMKDDIRTADDIVAHLPDRTPAETRHDLAAIVANFDDALHRMETLSSGAGPGDAEAGDFTAADLVPLYSALPILDARVVSSNAQTRLAAQNEMHFWGMLLTLVSWCSLIIAAACAAGIYLTLRDKHSAPLRALAQSIQNMARGDMRTAIWGTERQDMVGELARAVDVARYHFSHLPDLSLLSEQGPVRMRFEGGSRSLFEAMMKAISKDSENIRDQTLSLANAVAQQKDAIAALSSKVETVLGNILRHGQDGDRQIRQAIQEMVGSAENLKNAHAHSADQLNRIIPAIQDRAQGLTEIAHITGKQVASTLQSLTISEMNLKANAEQARETLGRLFTTADDLSERLFGAINLLQASGKVLAQTTEDMQTRMNSGEPVARPVVVSSASDADTLRPLFAKLEEMAAQLAAVQSRLGQQLGEQNHAPSSSLAPSMISEQTEIHAMLAAMQSQVERLEAVLTQGMAARADSDADRGIDIQLLSAGFTQLLAEQVNPRLDLLGQTIEQGMARKTDDLRAIAGHGFSDLRDRIDALAQNVRQDISAASARIVQATQDEFAKPIPRANLVMPPELQQQMQESWVHLAAQIEASRVSLDKSVREQVADKISSFEQVLAATRDLVAQMKDVVEHPPKMTFALPPELQKQMHDHWFQVTAQIEASRSGMIEAIAHQLEMMEGRISGDSKAGLSRTAADYATQRQIEQQTQILTELVSTLGALDAHMQQIKTEMRTAVH